MEVLSFVGIIIGLAVFIYFCTKGVNLVISGFTAALIIILTSGLPIVATITDTWAAGFSGFLKAYFLIFALSALFGKVLSDTGGTKSIAFAVYNLCSKSKKNSKFFAALFVPIMYGILTYAGISGFVVVFTVLDIGKNIFQKNNIPWRMYCYGGATSVATMILGGSLQVPNITAAGIAGTSTSAGFVLSLIGFVVYFGIEALLIKLDLNKAEKIGEGFMDTGAAFVEAEKATALTNDDKKLPSLILSVIPMVVMILSAALLNIHIIVALAIGIILCFVLLNKNIKSINATLTSGVTSCFVPTLGVAAASAIGTVIKSVPGFVFITDVLYSIPSLYGGSALILVMAFITASAPATIASFGKDAFALFTEAGLSPATSHRLMMGSLLTAIPPHSSGIVNATSVAKIEYSKGLKCYMKTTLIGGGCTLAVMLILVQLGIFV